MMQFALQKLGSKLYLKLGHFVFFIKSRITQNLPSQLLTELYLSEPFM